MGSILTESDSEPGPEPGYHPELGLTALAVVAMLFLALTPATVLLAAAATCLFAAFLFALFEASLEHHSRARLMDAAKSIGRDAQLTEILRREDELLFETKFARSLTQIVGIAGSAVCVAKTDAYGLTLILGTLGLAAAFLILNVALPQVLGRRAGNRILLSTLVAYDRGLWPLRPPARWLRAIASWFAGGEEPTDPEEEITDELLSVVEEGTREGTMAAEEKEMIKGIIDLREGTAEEIMTPRTDLVALSISASLEDAIEKSQDRGLARLPVYGDTPDEIVGVLYMKDLLAHWGKKERPSVERLMREPFLVPASKNIGNLLSEMKTRRIHLAIVLDEYGGTAGVVSIEDILEEIVGEITDEHEGAPTDVVRINENAATVKGRTAIDDLNDALGLKVPESEEYETVGGLLFSRLGHLPTAGEFLDVEGTRFTVLEADERRINRVKVTTLRPSA